MFKSSKKIIAVLLSAAMALSMCGCGTSSGKQTETEGVDTSDLITEVQNGDFETKDFSNWETTGSCIHVQTDDWATSNKTYFVKMSSDTDATFEISQQVYAATTDKYVASFDYEGYESFGGSVTLVVTKNDTELASVEVTPSKGWDFWETATTESFDCTAGDELTITVKGELVAGDWGDFDNVEFKVYEEAAEEEATVAQTFDISYGGATGSGTVNYEGITYNGSLVNNGNFIKGVDISSVISVENSGFVFKNVDGSDGDLFNILKESGVNCVRVRVWNDPYSENATEKTAATSYGGGVCDVNYAVEIAKRCKEAGLSLYVDFHYSDWWSDPGRSICPKAWAGMDLTTKAEALSEFTTDSLNKIAETGVNILIVSVGNETNYWMAGEQGIENIAVLMKSGAEAIRAFDPSILIAVHFTNPESQNYLGSYAQPLNEAGVDYDIFASSYYPFWHGTLENLKSKLDLVAEEYGKLTMIAEYSYSYTGSVDSTVQATFGEASEEGQENAIKLINESAAEIENCIGTFYWEPAWPVTENSTWDEYGSGWTSSVANEYDPDNAPMVAQSSACADQALFDAEGNPNQSIIDGVFNVLWTDGE